MYLEYINNRPTLLTRKQINKLAKDLNTSPPHTHTHPNEFMLCATTCMYLKIITMHKRKQTKKAF